MLRMCFFICIVMFVTMAWQPVSQSGKDGEVEMVEVPEQTNLSSVRADVVGAHMNKAGYGGKVFKGSVKTGFLEVPLESGFASEVATQPPLPEDCAF